MNKGGDTFIKEGEMREEERKFAEAMEEVLRLNDYKPGWDKCSMEYLELRLVEEFGEYLSSVMLQPKEIIDVANFAMMIWCRKTGVTK